MSKLRIVYVLSLAVLALLIVLTVFRPVARGGKYSEVTRESLIEAKGEWILQFDIINREGRDTRYNIQVTVADEQYGDQFLIQDGGVYTYIHSIRRNSAGSGAVGVSIYREGEAAPFREAIYYLR